MVESLFFINMTHWGLRSEAGKTQAKQSPELYAYDRNNLNSYRGGSKCSINKTKKTYRRSHGSRIKKKLRLPGRNDLAHLAGGSWKSAKVTINYTGLKSEITYIKTQQ